MLEENLEKGEEEIDLGAFSIPAYFYFELLQQRTGVTPNPGNYRAIFFECKMGCAAQINHTIEEIQAGNSGEKFINHRRFSIFVRFSLELKKHICPLEFSYV